MVVWARSGMDDPMLFKVDKRRIRGLLALFRTMEWFVEVLEKLLVY